MGEGRVERRLAAIVAADMVGYSAAMGRDEEGTLARVKALRSTIMDPCIAARGGRLVKTTGDGFLAEFPSVVDAFHCAHRVQRQLHQRDDPMQLRVAIHVGDVIHDEGDVFGEGVNIAARLEPLAPPGGIAVSRRAWEDLRRLGLPFEAMGEQTLKNIAEPVEVYSLSAEQLADLAPDERDAPAPSPPVRRRPSTAPRWAVAAGLGALALAGGGWALLGDRPTGIDPAVRLGGFPVISASAPKGLSQALRQELMAAFGIENMVTVIPDGERGRAPFLFDGSIREMGPLLRFTMTFKSEASGVMLWTSSFDSPIAAGPLAPRQVAVSASQIVRCALWGASAHKAPLSDRALSLYLQFCNEFWGGSSSEDRMLDAARKVTEAAPDFSFGWSARALTALPFTRREGEGMAALRREAADAARRAIALDAENPEGYMVQAGLLAPEAFAEREAMLKKAISVRPTECGCERQLYGDFLVSVGRVEEAVEQFRRGQDMQPLAPRSNVRLAHALYAVGRSEEAGQVLGRILEVWPYAESLQVLRIKAALWTGEHDAALAALDDPMLHISDSGREALRATFVALRGGPAERATAIDLLERLSRDRRRNDRLVVASLAALRAYPDAIAAADRLIRANSVWLADVLFEPNMAAAAGHPDYAALVGRLGLIRFWRDTDRWPDLCNAADAPAFCATT